MGGINSTKTVAQATTAPRTFGFPMSPVAPAPKSNIKGGVAKPAVAAPKPAVAPRTRTRPRPRPRPTSAQVYNQDVNANLKEAVIRGNEENTRTIGRFEGTARGLADQFNTGTQNLNNSMNRDMNAAYQGYDQRTRDILGQMGTASQDTHARLRGQAYAGLDSGFGEAGDQLQASLAARGLAGSGVFAKNMGDLARDRMMAGANANVTSYNQAISQDDSKRNALLNGEGTLYGAQQANLQGVYGRNMAQIGQNYGNRLGIEGQIMQNQLNNTQQRQANLMGYAQLGRGMAGMSQNYLASAGSGYQNIGQIAGNSAAQQGQLGNSYNAARWKADTDQQSGKGAALGAGLGGAAKLAMFSDMRLKNNVKELCKINGFTICTWDWNEKGIEIAGHNPTVGVIAQEAMKIDPYAVTEDKETGYLKVDYNRVFTGVAHG